MGFFADLGLEAGKIAANAFLSQRAAAYNQRMYEKNQEQNYKYAMMSQQNAPVNEVYGLTAAGLSPSFANGAQGMSVSSGTQGTAQPVSFDPANLLVMAQVKQIEAQTEKTVAETTGIKADTEDKLGAAETWRINLKHYFEDMAKNTTDEDTKQYYFNLAGQIGNAGAGRAFSEYLDLQNKSYGVRADIIENRVRAYIAELRKNKVIGKTDSDPFVKNLVDMPEREAAAAAHNVARLIAENDNLVTSGKLLKGELEQIHPLNVERLQTELNFLKETDLKPLLAKGKYEEALYQIFMVVMRSFLSK